MNLNFVILYVNDMDKAKSFYTDVLGMKVVEAASSPTFTTLQLANGAAGSAGAAVGLQDRAAARMPARHEPTGSVELSFESDDVDGTWKHWQEKGTEMVTEPMDLPFGRYFMAKDPEGHYLSVYRFHQRS